ncbi:unnamed protein product [Symbiodinium sp. CCMP2456]|nr:unnamed protein product [Symbiodinium sp. CCMP2456]
MVDEVHKACQGAASRFRHHLWTRNDAVPLRGHAVSTCSAQIGPLQLQHPHPPRRRGTLGAVPSAESEPADMDMEPDVYVDGESSLLWQSPEREFKAAKVLRQNSKERRCSEEQLKEFKQRFNYDAGATELAYQHPTSKMTAAYIITSQGGDHNGAFKGLDGGDSASGFWNMCYRLLQMSAHYNVVYRRVNSVKEATQFVESVKGDAKLGQAFKHVTISGHGNPGELVLGKQRLRSGEIGAEKSHTETARFLQALKPVLIHTGDARSTVFLDSCSTGQMQGRKSPPLAQCVAEALPGVEVHAFNDIMYPGTVKLQGDFLRSAQFQSESEKKGGSTYTPTTFMAKEQAPSSAALHSAVLLQRSNRSEDATPDFEFFDGMAFMANIEMCADWCALMEECHSFEFIEMEDEQLSPFGQCVLHAAADDTAADEPIENLFSHDIGKDSDMFRLERW